MALARPKKSKKKSKAKLSPVAMLKTYSTYATNFSFRKIYPGKK